MNKRIRKKKMTQKRNASRKLILSMDDGADRDCMIMKHMIRFDDYTFFHEVEGNVCPYSVIIPLMLEHINNLNKKEYKS